ncbi:MAG TPA: hypothetical protein VGO57_15090 [Verrucomicrobiae bacterium]|jgi:hypothetical protein
MKTDIHNRGQFPQARRRGFLLIDLVVGLAILAIAILPLGFSFVRERQVLRMEYRHSVANEIVDGEMEILMAGEAKSFPDGLQRYPVQAAAARQLPPGHFQLTKNGKHLRLEWLSDKGYGLGTIIRETTLP